MLEKFKEFLRGPYGKIVGVAIVIVGLAVVYVNGRDLFGESKLASDSRDRWFIDAESNKAFRYRIKLGDQFPIESPFTHKKTGFPAELCFWTKDGKVKNEPTPVLLNQVVGKRGPTFCPDCGRLVVQFNPMATYARTPPPTESEFKNRVGTESPLD